MFYELRQYRIHPGRRAGLNRDVPGCGRPRSPTSHEPLALVAGHPRRELRGANPAFPDVVEGPEDPDLKPPRGRRRRGPWSR